MQSPPLPPHFSVLSLAPFQNKEKSKKVELSPQQIVVIQRDLSIPRKLECMKASEAEELGFLELGHLIRVTDEKGDNWISIDQCSTSVHLQGLEKYFHSKRHFLVTSPVNRLIEYYYKLRKTGKLTELFYFEDIYISQLSFWLKYIKLKVNEKMSSENENFRKIIQSCFYKFTTQTDVNPFNRSKSETIKWLDECIEKYLTRLSVEEDYVESKVTFFEGEQDYYIIYLVQQEKYKKEMDIQNPENQFTYYNQLIFPQDRFILKSVDMSQYQSLVDQSVDEKGEFKCDLAKYFEGDEEDLFFKVKEDDPNVCDKISDLVNSSNKSSSKWKITKFINKGSYGAIFSSCYKFESTKKCLILKIQLIENKTDFFNEIECQNYAHRHGFAPKIYEYRIQEINGEEYGIIFMDYVDTTVLKVLNNSNFDIEEDLNILMDKVFQLIEFSVRVNLFHGDSHFGNIVLIKQKEDNGFIIQYIDFG